MKQCSKCRYPGPVESKDEQDYPSGNTCKKCSNWFCDRCINWAESGDEGLFCAACAEERKE
jgi:hypothetical protein